MQYNQWTSACGLDPKNLWFFDVLHLAECDHEVPAREFCSRTVSKTWAKLDVASSMALFALVRTHVHHIARHLCNAREGTNVRPFRCSVTVHP